MCTVWFYGNSFIYSDQCWNVQCSYRGNSLAQTNFSGCLEMYIMVTMVITEELFTALDVEMYVIVNMATVLHKQILAETIFYPFLLIPSLFACIDSLYTPILSMVPCYILLYVTIKILFVLRINHRITLILRQISCMINIYNAHKAGLKFV